VRGNQLSLIRELKKKGKCRFYENIKKKNRKKWDVSQFFQDIGRPIYSSLKKNIIIPHAYGIFICGPI
jgi:hypothetical protein